MPKFTYDLATITEAITKFEQEIEAMEAAREKIMPELQTLKEGWTSEGAKITTVSIEKFLNEDFENFLAMFNDAKERLNFAKHTFKQIDELE